MLFVCGGIASGAYVVSQVAGILASAPDQSPLAALRTVLGVPSGPTAPNLPAYSGTKRLTILLLGIDQRPDEAARHEPSRTDTMILLTVDPAARRAALISIPRDLEVAIPGHGNDKINTAHFWGEVDHPGSGPQLAMRTVEQNFGIPIDYYARVDFLAFIRLIDAIGGIVVDPARPILDDAYPTETYGVQRIYLPAGPQWLDGVHALQYARSRHSENDFARQSRQRDVILAAERKALRPAMVLKLPQLVGILQQSVGTDIPLTQIPALGGLARLIPAQNITSIGITYDMVVDVNHDGSLFLPNQPRIRALFDSVFTATAPTPTPIAPVTVEVDNGTTREGLAAATADELKARGFTIAQVAQAATTTQQHTTIVDRSGNRQAGAAVAQVIGVPATVVTTAPHQPGAADVTVVLGYDAPAPHQ
jgi:polyisoprenyl-teichoic acid--peptidoglycan teichoic acid transferase